MFLLKVMEFLLLWHFHVFVQGNGVFVSLWYFQVFVEGSGVFVTLWYFYVFVEGNGDTSKNRQFYLLKIFVRRQFLLWEVSCSN